MTEKKTKWTSDEEFEIWLQNSAPPVPDLTRFRDELKQALVKRNTTSGSREKSRQQ